MLIPIADRITFKPYAAIKPKITVNIRAVFIDTLWTILHFVIYFPISKSTIIVWATESDIPSINDIIDSSNNIKMHTVKT